MGDKQALDADLSPPTSASRLMGSKKEQEGEEPTGRRCARELAAASEEVEANRETVGGQEEPGRGGRGWQVSHTVSHVEQAMLETGLCFNRFCYWAKARTCRAPGTWSGN
jgi:hypothetical protein